MLIAELAVAVSCMCDSIAKIAGKERAEEIIRKVVENALSASEEEEANE